MFRIGLQPRSLQQINAVGNGGHHGSQTIPNCPWLTRQIDDQRLSPNSGCLSAENGSRDFFQGNLAHQFAKTRQKFVTDIHGGLGGHVTNGRTRSSGGDDQAALAVIGQLL